MIKDVLIESKKSMKNSVIDLDLVGGVDVINSTGDEVGEFCAEDLVRGVTIVRLKLMKRLATKMLFVLWILIVNIL